MGRAFVCWVFAACSYAPARSGTMIGDDDAPPTADSPVAPTDGAAIPMLPTYGTPTIVASLSDPSAEDDDPTVTGDLLELYFNSTRLGDADIFRSTRANVSQPWGPATLVSELETTSAEQDPEVSADGLTLWFASDRLSGNLDIFFTTRPDRASNWGTPVHVAELDSNSPDFSPAPIDDTHQLITSERAGSRDIYMSTRSNATSTWGTPQPIVEVNSPQNDQSGFLDASGHYLFLASERDGDRDLYVARRADPNAAFAMPQVISELASGVSESDPWVSADLRYIIFASDRSGVTDIYEAYAQ